MANTLYFVDSTTGNDADAGTDMDLAWATSEHAIEAGALDEGDYVFIRRIHGEVPASDILPNSGYDGEPDNPVNIMGWPRPAIPDTTITEGDFTNGSQIIDNVVGITPTREAHAGRFITAPDGEQYMILAVLYEAGVDGMAGGAEFTVLSHLTNTTQTKKGKIWAFTDDLDTTGTIQYARDSATAWVNNDNMTDADGGDAEMDVGGEAVVGFLIERKYAGSTVTSTNGKFQIDADEAWFDDMGAEYGFDDSAWTIKESDWDADAHDLPLIDFNDGAFQLRHFRANCWIYSYIEFKDSTDTSGIFFSTSQGVRTLTRGCLFKQTTANTELVRSDTGLYLDRCILEGDGDGGTLQTGLQTGSAPNWLRNVAIFNCSDNGIAIGFGGADSNTPFYNLSIGDIIPNGDNDILVEAPTVIVNGILGGTNGYVDITSSASAFGTSQKKVHIENSQNILGDHKSWFLGGTFEKVAVSGETPNKKLSDNVLKITPDLLRTPQPEFAENVWKVHVMTHEIQAVTGSQTFKYWVYNNAIGTLNTVATDDVYLEVEYVKTHDDSSEYTMVKALSTETSIASAASADDWDSLSVTINPAVASKVRIRVFWSKYHVSGTFFIDPQVVIT